MATKTFQIPLENLSRVTDAIDAINKRARRLKVAEVTITISDPFPAPLLTVRTTGVITKSSRMYDHVTVTIDGETPRLNGWAFVGVIEAIDDQVVIRAHEEIPEYYRTSGTVCEHCRITRRRNKSYVLQSETGEFKAVGSTCLEDFTGAHNPFTAANVAEMRHEIEIALGAGECIPMEGGMGDRIFTETFMRQVACLIRKNGFVSAKQAQNTMCVSTGDSALEILLAKPDKVDEWRAAGFAPTEEDNAVALAAMEWAVDLSNTHMSDFEHNLHAIAKTYTFPFKLRNIAACVVSSYLRTQQEKKERELQSEASSYIGEVGKRLEIKAQLVFRKAIDSLYGTTYLHKFITDTGCVCVWFSSAGMLDIEPNTFHVLKGTVKKHDEREGVKQTTLTRVSLAK